MKKKGLTLIELLIVVAIIGILAAVTLASIDQSRKNTRINGVKTTLKSIIPVIISCKDSGGAVTPRVEGNAICNPVSNFSGAFWPTLPNGYAYSPEGGSVVYDSNACAFTITAGSDSPTPISCSCVSQNCK